MFDNPTAFALHKCGVIDIFPLSCGKMLRLGCCTLQFEQNKNNKLRKGLT